MEKDDFVIKAHLEAVKEVGRWIVLFILSWVITQTLAQLQVIPEHSLVHVWKLVYLVPTRFLVQFFLTLIGRYIDKWFHLNPNISLKGLLPW